MEDVIEDVVEDLMKDIMMMKPFPLQIKQIN